MEGALLANVLKILEGVVGALWRFITRRPVVPKHTLRIVPKESDCWWYLGSKADQPAMQIAGRWNVTNITDGPVHVVGVRMVRPNLTGIALVQHAERGAFGRYPVLAGRMAEVTTDFWFQPPNRKEGKDLVVRIEFTDNFGNRHKTKKVRFQSRSRVGTTESDVATEPVYQITDPIVRNVVSVLKAEVERYRSCGRSVGGLGSVETHFEGQIMKGVGTEWREADSPRQ